MAVPARGAGAVPGLRGAVQWLVGRQTAECAACDAPLPRADGAPVGLPRPRLLRRAA